MTPLPNKTSLWLPYSEQWLDALHPDYTDVKVEDIAWPLSNIVRFTGQLPPLIPRWEASVLTHSALCYDIAEGMGITDEKILRTIFFHDAQEAIVNDVAGPVKRAMREVARRGDILAGRVVGAEAITSDYDQIEDRHEWALAQRFDLIMPKTEIVHHIDRLAFAFECREFFGDERSNLGEVSEDPDDVPLLAIKRRYEYSDQSVAVRLAMRLDPALP